MNTHTPYYRSWFFNIRADILSGIVVALALIPEAIGFSAIAGVDPKVGLFASFAIACTAAFTGGRPGMISAATAATAVVMVSLVKEHGLDYLFAATLLMGVLQILAGFLKLGRVMRFVSRSVITGFVNALAILIFMAQLPELIGVPTATYYMIAGGLAIIYLFPRVTKVIPSPLVAIAVLTGVSLYFGMNVRTVGDLGELPSSLPFFIASARAAHLRDAANHLPLFGDACGRRAARIADDGADRRRHDRHDQFQEPGMHRPGRGQYRRQPDRRHGRLRDDRPVGD